MERYGSGDYNRSMAVPFSASLLEILVCPVCHARLESTDAASVGSPEAGNEGIEEWLRCLGCGLCYPIQDGIPVMLADRAIPSATRR